MTERRDGHAMLAWDSAAQALKVVDPNPPCGWCSDGVFVQGNKASIEAVIAAFHSHGQIDELKRNLRHWREECGKLHAKLSTIADIAEGSGTVNSLPHIAKIARGKSSGGTCSGGDPR